MAELTSQLHDEEFIRYSRQIMLDDWAEVGQINLSAKTVVIIGCGGLGNVVATFLCGAGVGTLRLVDHDHVELSNLPRQIAFDSDSVQNAKAFELANRLKEQNPHVNVVPYVEKLVHDNARHLLDGADLVVDCSDNFATRYVINHQCIEHRVALVSGAVIGWQGQLLLVDPNDLTGGCYRCVFEQGSDEHGSCQTSGVSGPMVGVIGSYQANEALRYLLQLPSNLSQSLRLIDGATFSQQQITRKRRSGCITCGNK